jgi:hypothetical protein
MSFSKLYFFDQCQHGTIEDIANLIHAWRLYNVPLHDMYGHALSMVAGRGNLEMVQMLFPHCDQSQINRSLVRAAANGHVELFKFLFDLYDYSHIGLTLYDIGLCGNLEIYNITRQRYPCCTSSDWATLRDGAYHGNHIDLIRLIPDISLYDSILVRHAYRHNNPELIRRVTTYGYSNMIEHEDYNYNAACGAAEGGHLEHVRTYITPAIAGQMILYACHYEQINVVDYILENFTISVDWWTHVIRHVYIYNVTTLIEKFRAYPGIRQPLEIWINWIELFQTAIYAENATMVRRCLEHTITSLDLNDGVVRAAAEHCTPIMKILFDRGASNYDHIEPMHVAALMDEGMNFDIIKGSITPATWAEVCRTRARAAQYIDEVGTVTNIPRVLCREIILMVPMFNMMTARDIPNKRDKRDNPDDK